MRYTDSYYQEVQVSGAGTHDLVSFLPSPGEDSDGVFDVLVAGRSTNGTPFVDRVRVPYSKVGSSVTLGTLVHDVTALVGLALVGASITVAVSNGEIVTRFTGLLGVTIELGVSIALEGTTP